MVKEKLRAPSSAYDRNGEFFGILDKKDTVLRAEEKEVVSTGLTLLWGKNFFPHFSVPVLAEISSSLLRKSMNRLDTGFTSSGLNRSTRVPVHI
jgi:hypothetical protein